MAYEKLLSALKWKLPEKKSCFFLVLLWRQPARSAADLEWLRGPGAGGQ